MPADYTSIRADNERRYGTDIGRIGKMLLADRYDDRTHFIFELLQNAEDALARREGWQGSRAVTFHLSATELRVAHCGQPFNDRDVRGICGIAEGTKDEDLTAIGRFGIGFKSVNAFTPRPEVHSGGEDFAIESYVWPVAIQPIDRQPDETVFVLPLDPDDKTAHEEIADGLQRLGPRTLLFLRQIEEIAWSVEEGRSGMYVRGKPETSEEGGERLDLLGEERDMPDAEETWLLFSRAVATPEGTAAGFVSIGFSLVSHGATGRWSVHAVGDSPLVAFFPTVLRTQLGFLVQGPFRTTPSRDNVPLKDPWNLHLVEQTADLVADALRALRAQGLLDVDALLSLPIEREKFQYGNSLVAPLFTKVLTELKEEPLLPESGGGHVTAAKALLARTQELRVLFDPQQLGDIFGDDEELFWLSGEITQDRTPQLRQYLTRDLDIVEVTSEMILPKLSQAFLERQGDEWTQQLYEFLQGQPALIRQGRLDDVSLIRLDDGSHVTLTADGERQAFLPSGISTDFPTVRRAVCRSDAALSFLGTLGLTEPDPVDDVVRNVLPKYGADKAERDDLEYERDIKRVIGAFGTDSADQRERLLEGLRKWPFVRAVDAGDGTKRRAKPGDVYLATHRLKDLFDGVSGVLLVDDTCACLRGEDARDMLEACGASRYLQPVPTTTHVSEGELDKIRRRSGETTKSSAREVINDVTLRGLPELLSTLTKVKQDIARKKAALLWEALCDVEQRGASAFRGSYRWFHVTQRSSTFDAESIRQLNETAWVPDEGGDLRRPAGIHFDSLSWEANPFLLTRILFRPPVLDQLAKEAGIETGVLDLLKKLGMTSEAAFRDRLGLDELTAGEDTAGEEEEVDDRLRDPSVRSPDPTAPDLGKVGLDQPASDGDRNGAEVAGTRVGTGVVDPGSPAPMERGASRGAESRAERDASHRRSPGTAGGRPFISYVGAEPDEQDADPDGVDHSKRMALEGDAIDRILAREPHWLRTPPGNPGFDLVQYDQGSNPVAWCEVKAMTGTLRDRPVGLSSTQFDHAREHGDAYWLYVVERAGSTDARIVRIQDPAGKARTFTFDHGWLNVAELDSRFKEDPPE